MNKVTITGEDLFFLSKIMKAKYIDYDYIRLVSELSSGYALKESNAIEHLSDQGLIYEDFSGDVEIEDLAKEFIDPIFFGEFESELLIEDRLHLKRFKYHVLNGQYIQVEVNNNLLTITKVNKEDILEHLPYIEELSSKAIYNLDHFENKDIDGIMVLKRNEINKRSRCLQLVNDNGVYYRKKGLKIHSLTKEELKQLIRTIIWEE